MYILTTETIHTRATFDRIANSIGRLPSTYFHNKALIGMTTTPELKDPSDKEAPRASTYWSIGHKSFESVTSLTAMAGNHQESRVSKKQFFEKYLKLVNQLNVGNGDSCVHSDNTYGEAKLCSQNYQVSLFIVRMGE